MVFVEVMESLSEDADPRGVGKLIIKELRRTEKSVATLSRGLASSNIISLEEPSLTNLIGVFPETGKTTFVEHRSFLHLYRSFHRLLIFLVLMFQGLTIVALNDNNLNSDTFKLLLSLGLTFTIMNFVESALDILFMFGAYTTARGMALSRLVIRFFWWGLSSAFVTYVYLKVLQERNQNSDNSLYFRIYVIMFGVYAGLRLFLALLLKFPACHKFSEMSDQSFFQIFKWIYQMLYYVGRGLYERMGDYCRFVIGTFELVNVIFLFILDLVIWRTIFDDIWDEVETSMVSLSNSKWQEQKQTVIGQGGIGQTKIIHSNSKIEYRYENIEITVNNYNQSTMKE